MGNDREITVLILCYDSAETLIETLESVKNQSYGKIHIIVSDDCSTDNTYNLAAKWVNENQERFLTSICRQTKFNMGVSQHMNECIRLVPTEWFKGLAGDDILLPNCIENYVNYIETHKCHGMVYAKHLCFSDDKRGRHYFIDYEEQLYQKKFSFLPVEKQRIEIARREVLCSPTCFTNRDDVISAGGYDARIKNIEDWPIKMRLLDNGYKMNRMDEYTVLYRMGNSISRSNDLYFKPEFIAMERRVKELYCYPIAKESVLYRWNNAVTYFRYKIIIRIFGNRRTFLTKLVNYCIGVFNTEKAKKVIINIRYKKDAKAEVQYICDSFKLGGK